jgi:hypothetical protein
MNMSYLTQLAIEALVSGSALILMLNFLSRFKVKKSVVLTILFPLAVFTAGFSLRLTGAREIVDMGFFLTDFSFLFTYLLFASSFVLGQLKYWKKNSGE